MFTFIFFIENGISAQCGQATLKPFSEIGLSEFTLNIQDINSNDSIWQIRYWPKYEVLDSLLSDSIFTHTYKIENLNPGTEYEIYIRNICPDDISSWNGPFYEKTLIENNNSCGLLLDIRDNNCPGGNDFGIFVEGYDNSQLGNDVFLSNIKVIIEHDWPADLVLSLSSPWGTVVELSNNIGIGLDNYGNPTDEDCNEVLRFDMNACQNITNITQEMVGSYIPIGDFSDFYNETSPNGIWQLFICDQAAGAIGQLKYVELKFSPVICSAPQNIGISSITDTSFSISWVNTNACNHIIIESGLEGYQIGLGNNIALPCTENSYTVKNLNPNTIYDFVLYNDCNGSISSPSCREQIKTSCSNISLTSNFDNLPNCETSCMAPCFIEEYVWHNNMLEDQMDWIVHSGSTATLQTGPEHDVFLTGNYLYIENTKHVCDPSSISILESNCILIHSTPSNCDLSFSYHMYGQDINQLALVLSIDNLSSWDTLLVLNGPQGQSWHDYSVDLSDYDNEAGVFRFIAWSGDDEFGDIALDNIVFHGSEVLFESIPYYLDQDNDGYGSNLSIIYSCNIDPPSGYANIGNDCDDTDELINPGAAEINCNLIDENCNGLTDDQPINNPIIYTITNETKNEFCEGNNDGLIVILVSGGTPPYQYLWNNGETSNRIDSIGTGTYKCTITDSDSCKLVTNPIHLSASFEFFASFDITQPSCEGLSDGNIIFSHLGVGPFTYEWSDGSTNDTIINISKGTYWVRVSNSICSEVDTVIVDAPQQINYQSIVGNVTCNGFLDGKIEIIPDGQLDNFTFLWNNGADINIIDQLSAGTYQCTISNLEGCTNTTTINVSEPDSLQIRIDAIDPITCYGSRNGHIKASGHGGTTPYFFLWDTNDFTYELDSLEAGLYTLTLTDFNGCISIKEDINIEEKPPIIITLDSIHNVNCPESYDGYLSVSVEGGAGEYQYFWNKTDRDTASLDSLLRANYILRVVDKFGCKVRFEKELLLLNTPLNTNTELYKINLCYDDSIACINTIVIDGIAPYIYHWSTGDINETLSPIDSIIDLSMGNYQVTITDNRGCTGASEIIEIVDIPVLNFGLLSWQDMSCHGVNDGFFEVSGFGGTPPYQYEWNNGVIENSIHDLGAGNYMVTIYDNNNCIIKSPSFEILEPDPITIDIKINYNEFSKLSTISVQPLNGNPPYIIFWDDIYQDTGVISQRFLLPLQDYHVLITDNDGCIKDTLISISDIVAIENLWDLNSINVYPNPNRGSFLIEMLEIKQQKNIQLSIKNLLGSNIYLESFSLSGSDNFLDIQLPEHVKGILFLEISSDNIVHYRTKLIVIN